MRFIAPIAVVVLLAGGYGIAQQSADESDSRTTPVIEASDLSDARTLADKSQSQIGRYVPFHEGRLLDTASGTLFEVSDGRWKTVATLPEGQEPSVYVRLSRERESTFHEVEALLRRLGDEPLNGEVKHRIDITRFKIDTLDDVLDSVLPTQNLTP
jgi:hypothetical protein